MPNWRRAHVPGGSYFFAVVTDRRAPLFRDAPARRLSGRLIQRCQLRWPFSINALVLLPDHLDAIWSLPPGDDEYSKRCRWINEDPTKYWLRSGGQEQPQTAGRRRDRRRGVWQPKFWEHTLEDDDDFERHFDDVHDNPVKHGYVKCPRDWPWSSFHRWVRRGVNPIDWACWEGDGELDFSDIAGTVGE